MFCPTARPSFTPVVRPRIRPSVPFPTPLLFPQTRSYASLLRNARLPPPPQPEPALPNSRSHLFFLPLRLRAVSFSERHRKLFHQPPSPPDVFCAPTYGGAIFFRGFFVLSRLFLKICAPFFCFLSVPNLACPPEFPVRQFSLESLFLSAKISYHVLAFEFLNLMTLFRRGPPPSVFHALPCAACPPRAHEPLTRFPAKRRAVKCAILASLGVIASF